MVVWRESDKVRINLNTCEMTLQPLDVDKDVFEMLDLNDVFIEDGQVKLEHLPLLLYYEAT
jgi:hypothetical protein